MPYSKQTWSDNNPTYPLSAARMGVIEQGIFDAAAVADQGHRILTTSAKNLLTGVPTGTMVYDSTLGRLEVYNGTAWVAATGLVPIIPPTYNISGGSAVSNSSTLISWSGASSVSVNGVFTSLYRNYRVLLDLTHQSTNGSDMYARLRLSGTDVTGSDYQYQGTASVGANAPTTYSGGGTFALIGYGAYPTNQAWSYIGLEIMAPSMPQWTRFEASSGGVTGGAYGHIVVGDVHKVLTAYDGLTIYPPSGTFSGTLRIYGYAGEV